MPQGPVDSKRGTPATAILARVRPPLMLVVDQVDITEMSTKARGTDVFDVPDDKMFAFLDRNAVLGLTPETLFSHVDKVVYVELFELTKGRVLEHEKFVEQLAKWLKGKERDWVSSDVEAAAWRLVGFTYFAEMWSIAAPVVDDKMIVIKEPYTSLIMDGMKTMELRCQPINGEYFLADSTTHTVKAKLVFGESTDLSPLCSHFQAKRGAIGFAQFKPAVV